MAAPGLILSPSYQTITPRPAFGPTVVIPENSSPCNVAEPSPTKPAAPCADSVAANRKQAELFPSWRYHAFITDREGSAIFLDADHRNHAVVELNIRDLKEGAGMAHCPSGDFNANAAWTVLATVAHNMVRWIASLGLEHHGPVVMKTIRRKFLTVPGRLTRRSRRMQLHLPTAWPWATEWSACFDRLRALPPRT